MAGLFGKIMKKMKNNAILIEVYPVYIDELNNTLSYQFPEITEPAVTSFAVKKANNKYFYTIF